MMFRLLRRLRIIIELAVLAGFVLAGIGGGTLLLTGFQFIPDGLKAVSLGLLFPVAIFIFFAITALISGRIYCSSLCPFGILQDI
ncbi:MAG: 4Fe-4S binding protein, partial [Victivallales bacterium]|nr:4Fe-4S binding protein [Victivallales bacterium]